MFGVKNFYVKTYNDWLIQIAEIIQSISHDTLSNSTKMISITHSQESEQIHIERFLY